MTTMMGIEMEVVDRIRAKQDHLLELAERRHLNEDLQISAYWPGAPTLRQCRSFIYPEFEEAIDDAIMYLEGRS